MATNADTESTGLGGGATNPTINYSTLIPHFSGDDKVMIETFLQFFVRNSR